MVKLLDFLVDQKAIISFAEGRRLLNSALIKVDGNVIHDNIELSEFQIVQVGKRFVGSVEDEKTNTY